MFSRIRQKQLSNTETQKKYIEWLCLSQVATLSKHCSMLHMDHSTDYRPLVRIIDLHIQSIINNFDELSTVSLYHCPAS